MGCFRDLKVVTYFSHSNEANLQNFLMYPSTWPVPKLREDEISVDLIERGLEGSLPRPFHQS